MVGVFFASLSRANLLEEAREITKLDNPNSTSQLLNWLEEAGEEGLKVSDQERYTAKRKESYKRKE